MSPKVHIGFTGTQAGMTSKQKDALRLFLSRGKRWIVGFHHGDCIGADAEAHDIAADVLGVERIFIHPCNIDAKRAYRQSPNIYPVEKPLVRNQVIVDVTTGLVAAPKSPEEELRSGTWSTIRRARKLNRPIKMLVP